MEPGGLVLGRGRPFHVPLRRRARAGGGRHVRFARQWEPSEPCKRAIGPVRPPFILKPHPRPVIASHEWLGRTTSFEPSSWEVWAAVWLHLPAVGSTASHVFLRSRQPGG